MLVLCIENCLSVLLLRVKINSDNLIKQSLFTSEITGSSFLTGGRMGPQSSIQSLLFCSLAALLFLWLGKKKNNFIKPYWKNNLSVIEKNK